MADMEADNMAREMTPQERAAALLERMGLCGHPAASQFVGDIIEHDQQTRRAALLEVARHFRGEIMDPDGEEYLEGYNSALRHVSAWLELDADRLAQEG